jgi:phosphomannomutase/phosphoglucomutase
LGYAALDLIHRAETEANPEVELHLPNQASEHIVLARRILVPGSEQALGVLYLALPATLLDVISQLPEGAALRLEQRNNKVPPSTLRSLDSGTFGADAATPVTGTLWQIAATLPSQRPAVSTSMLWTTLLIASLLLAGGGWLLLRFFQESLRRDQIIVVQAVRGTLANNALPFYRLQWMEMLGLLESLQAVAKDAAAGGLTKQPGSGAAAAKPKAGEADSKEAAFAEAANLVGRLTASVGAAAAKVPTTLFLGHEIGGKLSELTPAVAQVLGQAIGSEARSRSAGLVVVAHDYRESSPALARAVCAGLQASGIRVIDLGQTALPVWQFAIHFLPQAAGIWIGASQQESLTYNGLRVIMDGQISQPEVIQAVALRVKNQDFNTGNGAYETQNLLPEYIGQLSNDVPLARMMKVVVDAGGGLTGQLAPMLLRTLGCEVIEVNCEFTQQAHTADPLRPESLIPLARRVREEQADLGLAYDADGDRYGVVDSTGDIIWADTLLMLFAADVLARQPGTDIIYDVECSRHLAPEIVQRGGRPVLVPTGWLALQTKLRDSTALLAGGVSGHIFFKERWFGFADALYASARLLEIISADLRPSHEVFTELPRSPVTPQLRCAVPDAVARMVELQIAGPMLLPQGAKITTLDGLRAEFEQGWGIVRASHGSQSWLMRFEADDTAALAQVQQIFRELLTTQFPDIKLPF